MYRKSKLLKLKKLWLEHGWVGAMLVFIISLTMFSIWTAAPVFSDPDTFYHLKIVKIMIARQQAIVDFPWLQFTTLKDAFVDHHFLYHVFLIPFILFFDTFIGMKVASVLLSASTITLFYLLLRSVHIRFALIFSMLLLFTSSFAFRIALAKAPSTGYLFLVGAFFLIMHQKHRLLTLLGFFYVWSYGGFLLLPVLAFAYSLTHLLSHVYTKAKLPSLKELFSIFKPLWASLAGIAAGLLIHPSFPQHLKFYWQQIFQIGLINYQGVIGVGGEWYPAEIQDLLASPLILTSLLIFGLLCFIFTLKKQSYASATALIMTVIFFVFTTKSQRYIEYYIPWAFIFTALSLHYAGALDQVRTMLLNTKQKIISDTFLQGAATMVLIYLAFIIPGVIINEARTTYDQLRGGIPITRYEKSGTWLREHCTKGDIIFHNDWDDFPILFYRVARARYIVGLDPTFMYNYDQDLYWKWVNITLGKTTDNLLEIIQGDFDARFVVVDHNHKKMNNNIINDGRFKEAYRDDEVIIYRVPRKEINQSEDGILE